MRIKQFVIYALMLIALVGVFVYLQTEAYWEQDFHGYFKLNLPIAVWFMIPMAILLVVTVLHMIYYSLGFYRTKKRFLSDSATYDEVAKEVLLGFDSNKEFKTDIFKSSNELVRYLSPFNGEYTPKLENKALDEIVSVIAKVKKGEYVDLKKFRVPNDSQLFIDNALNRLAKEPSYAQEVLKDKKIAESSPIKKKALEMVMQTGNMLEIKRFKNLDNKDDIACVLGRYIDGNLEITKDEIVHLLARGGFSAEEYVAYAKSLKEKMDPETVMATFEKVRAQSEEASEAYLYLLYEFGMIDKIREFLNFSNEKFEKIRTLLFLRDSGKSAPASYFY